MYVQCSYLVVWLQSLLAHESNLRGHNKGVVPQFFTNFMKNSVCHRGAVLRNCVSEYFNDSCNFEQFYSKAKSSPIFGENRFAIK